MKSSLVIVPNGNDGEVGVHRYQVNIRPVLVVPPAVVVESGDLGTLGRRAADTSTTSGVLVDVVAEVDDIVGVLVHHGARVRREEAATVG